MIYEKPEMEVWELGEESVVFTSISQGGTSTEIDGPAIDWNGDL